MSLEYLNDPQLNRELQDVLLHAIERCHHAYEGQAKSFAVILHDLEKLLLQFQRKLDMSESNVAKLQEQQVLEKDAAEKIVYVRLFHKLMPTLTEEKSSLVWVRSLLESIKTAEKHGLAVYANEDNVKRSLKSDKYGYATLKISHDQDTTDRHAPKIDVESNCPLLTIKAISLDNILKLTYAGKDYLIKDGVIHRPNHKES